MSAPKKIKLVLAWHMHQPHYRDGLDGQYRLPWVYLHALKDYSDMVAHLETCPGAKVVVNFAPVLLEQLDDYGQQMRQWLNHKTPMQDPMLNWLSGATPIPTDEASKLVIIENCLKAYAPTMIAPLPQFEKMVQLAQCCGVGGAQPNAHYLNDAFFVDLLVWYHLAWLGQSLRLCDARVQRLMQKMHDFSSADRTLLFEVMADCLEGIIPRYRALLESGQIEISMTPYGHPIVPLLIDFESMRDSQPNDPIPDSKLYPDGYQRAKWHMEHGLKVFKKYFGQKPQGVWLSEGAVSEAAVGLLDHYEIKWTASGEGVWRHSCEASNFNIDDITSRRALYQPLQHASQNCRLFFRDDGLSDLIGFQYKDWNPQDAANNFVHHLTNIANAMGDKVEEYVVSVVLDGENAWEYYPENAHHFLNAFYTTLEANKHIEMVTFSEALAAGVKVQHLPVLKAGSWVYGSFSTWIGSKDKNAAWDLLVAAKQTYDSVMASDKLNKQAQKLATEQLAVCEGSDWFWWFGDYNPSGSVKDFDQLYRRHLQQLYILLGETPPASLQVPLSAGGGSMDNGGVMQRGIST